MYSRPGFLSKAFTIALFQGDRNVPDDTDKLISLVMSGRKTSGCIFSSLVGMVSDKQVVGFALDNSHLTSPEVTGLKKDILGKSFGKVKGTLGQSSRLNDSCIVLILS